MARLAYAEPAEVEYLLKRGPEPFKAGPDEGPLYRAVEAAVADLAGYTFYTGKEHPDPAARRDAQAYLLLYPSRRTIVLAFRGTQSLADALDDADLRLKPLQEEVQATSALAPLAEEPEVVVHSGFREQVGLLVPPVAPDALYLHPAAFCYQSSRCSATRLRVLLLSFYRLTLNSV